MAAKKTFQLLCTVDRDRYPVRSDLHVTIDCHHCSTAIVCLGAGLKNRHLNLDHQKRYCCN